MNNDRKNADSVMEKKLDELLSQLTLDEKIGMIHGAGLFRTEGVERLGIPPLKTSDGPMGVRAEFEDAAWRRVEQDDNYVTYGPSNTAVAASWNPVLAGICGEVLGEEARGRGKDVILAPGINIQRVPECGRNFEYFSEDPCLTAKLAVPMVKGIQQSDVAACVKHYALNQQETERVWVNVEVEEQTLRELYLPAFEAVVREGGLYSIMGAYNLFRGSHCCENKVLLDDILREEWGYDGTVISDWGAVHDTKAAAETSLDLEMSVTSDFDQYCLAEPLKKKILAGEIDEAHVDEKVRNILRMMFRLNMLDGERKSGSVNTKSHQNAVRMAAEESIVLLKNEESHLPLDAGKQEKILVVGDNAVRKHAPGGGSAEIEALYEIAPLQGIRMLLGGNADVAFARGYAPAEHEEFETNWQEDSLKDQEEDALAILHEDRGLDRELAEEAAAMAREADRVIFIGGLNHDYDIEGHDRHSLKLPYGQDDLIRMLVEANREVTVVMYAGSPVDMSSWKDRVKSIVWMSYAGMEGGLALAEVLFGQVNPSGHLAQSLPFENAKQFVSDRKEDTSFPGRSLTSEEASLMHANLTESYEEGRLVGYRYYCKKQIPVQYAFGHGLSYTDFALRELSLAGDSKLLMFPSLSKDLEMAAANVTVENTGDRAGKAVIQIYVGRNHPETDEPLFELKGFEKTMIEPGKTRTVSIPLKVRDFAHYDCSRKQFVVLPDEYTVYAGQSSDQLSPCGTFRLEQEILCSLRNR